MTTATTSATATLEENAQALIDARLDTIERMLLGQVSRGDRLAIVREVESQIHDLLANRRPDETDRSVVIAALSRLDPPEAYLPDDEGEGTRPTSATKRPRTTVTPRLIPSPSSKAPGSIAGKVSCILGGLSLVLLILTAMGFSDMVRNHNPGFVITVSLMAFITVTTSVLAFSLATYSRFSSTWALTGLLAGLVSFFLVLLMILVSLVRGVSPNPPFLTTENGFIRSSSEPMFAPSRTTSNALTTGPTELNEPPLERP